MTALTAWQVRSRAAERASQWALCRPSTAAHARMLRDAADKATRIIAEVVIESLPQCFLQSYIYVVVLYHSHAGTASPSELAMLEFTSVLPTSILISMIAMLKMWIEVRATMI